MPPSSQFPSFLGDDISGRTKLIEDLYSDGFGRTFGLEIPSGIVEREDGDAVYYDIKVPNVSTTSISTKVENGYVTITGTTEKKSGESDNDNESDDFSSMSVFQSNFSRTFPVPENVDPNKMQMTSEKDKIVLMFPKVKA